MKDKGKKNYTEEDKVCPHCGGNISPHFEGTIIYWCDKCGSNNPDAPPSIKVTLAL